MLPTQQHAFCYQSFDIYKSQPLGHGSYGAVYKAKCDQLPCAAKILHPTILDPTDPGAGKIMTRFQQECAFLESIRHPNIVQYLGVTRDPKSRLPVLLMELLDESLTKVLERSQQSLAYYVQVDICHDIALAVAYLHSNDIIHRDLSSNNVLMIAGRRAKVTDFGMSKLAGAAPSMTPLTMCPGTQAYMPPEALREPPRYTKKLDCFSEGVIMIQVCTRLWPDPGPRHELISDSRSPTGTMDMPVLETERRKNHIDLIDPNHTLLPIAINCLQFQEKDRPSSEELCQKLADLKESREYRDSNQNHRDEIQAKDYQIMSQAQQVQEKDRLLQQKTDEIETQNQQLQEKDKAILDKDNQLQQQSKLNQEEIALRERQLQQLNQQLEEQEQVTTEIQHSLQRQVEQLQQQLSQQSLKPPQPPPSENLLVKGRQLQERESPKQSPAQPSLQADYKPHPLIILKWRNSGKAPFGMSRGAAVVNGNVAYFVNWDGNIRSYDSSSKRWREVPKCPYEQCSLAIISGQLTTVGGMDIHCKFTNKLLSLQTGKRQNEFKEIFPSMPTKRCCPTAATIKEHLIVAGGLFGFSSIQVTTTVEVMDTKTLVWSTVASLPHPYTRASGTICGDQLYMLGGSDAKGKTKSVLTCSLTKLLQSSSSSSSIWHRVADAPAYRSTCAAVKGELLAVGGCSEDDKPTIAMAIYKYDLTTNSWYLISNMPSFGYQSLVAVLPSNEMMVVGGSTELLEHLDKVEIAKF